MKIAGKIVLSMLCALIVWEIILQHTVIKTPGYTQHPVLGKVLNKGTYVNGQEGFGVTKVYPLGVIGSPYKQQKDSYNILLLGDSYTEAVQVPDSVKYAAQLRALLEKRGKREIQTINMGRSSASPANYIHLSDFYNRFAKPDTVIVQMSEGDYRDMVNEGSNFYVSQQGGTYTTVFNSDYLSKNKIASRFSGLYSLLRMATVRIGFEKLEQHMSHTQAAANSRGDAEDIRAMTAWALSELHKRYSNLVLVFLPILDFEHPSAAPSELEQAVKAEAARQGIPLADMHEPFLKYYKEHRQPAYGFNNTTPGYGHMNEIGHKVLAQTLARMLEGRVTP